MSNSKFFIPLIIFFVLLLFYRQANKELCSCIVKDALYNINLELVSGNIVNYSVRMPENTKLKIKANRGSYKIVGKSKNAIFGNCIVFEKNAVINFEIKSKKVY